MEVAALQPLFGWLSYEKWYNLKFKHVPCYTVQNNEYTSATLPDDGGRELVAMQCVWSGTVGVRTESHKREKTQEPAFYDRSLC